MSIYKTRIEQMKELLAKEGIDFYLVPTADFHIFPGNFWFFHCQKQIPFPVFLLLQ